MSMHQWRSCQIRAFVPPGKQLYVSVSFHTPAAENEVRIQSRPHAHEAGLARFVSTEEGTHTWVSSPNQGTATAIYWLEARYRDANRPAPAWMHFDDDHANLLYEDAQNAVYGFEEGRDRDYDDAIISLHWRDVALD